MPRATCLIALGVILFSAPLAAEVQDAATTGFTSLNTAEIAAPVDQVFAAFLAIEHWWHPDHTYWGDAAGLYLEPRVGGFFGERQLDGDGEVHHAEILWLDPQKGLRLQGGFGPLQQHALHAVLTVGLSQTESGTTDVSFKYAVGGYVPGGVADWAPVVDGVLQQQLSRLQAYAETGEPVPSGRN
jgi:uncharacterized protein YndB with AHSA1/START domain